MFLFAYAFPCFQTKLDKKLVQLKQTHETHIILCFKLEYRYRLSVSANIGPKISVNFHIGASLVGSKVKLALFFRNESDITGS